MKEEQEFLKRIKYIDYNGKEYDINDLDSNERFKQLFSSFHILHRPLIKIFNDNDCLVTLDDRDKNNIFNVSNITDKVREECKSFGILI